MAFNDPDIEKLARPQRERIEELRPEYERAKAWVTENVSVHNAKLIEEIEGMVMIHDRKDPPESAVFIVAQVRQLLYDFRANDRIVEEYERLKRSLDAHAKRDFERTGANPTPEGT